jgi:hypothetical protein
VDLAVAPISGFGQKGQLVIGMSEDWFMVSNTKAHNPTTNSVD